MDAEPAESPFDRRFAAECLTAFFAASGALLAGYHGAEAVLRWLLPDAAAVVITAPSDPFFARVQLGLSFALPVVVAWLALVVHRLAARRAPGPVATIAYVAIPIAMAALELGLHFSMLHEVADPVGGIAPMLALRDLLPGPLALDKTLLGSLVLLVAVFVVGRRAR